MKFTSWISELHDVQDIIVRLVLIASLRVITKLIKKFEKYDCYITLFGSSVKYYFGILDSALKTTPIKFIWMNLPKNKL